MIRILIQQYKILIQQYKKSVFLLNFNHIKFTYNVYILSSWPIFWRVLTIIIQTISSSVAVWRLSLALRLSSKHSEFINRKFLILTEDSQSDWVNSRTRIVGAFFKFKFFKYICHLYRLTMKNLYHNFGPSVWLLERWIWKWAHKSHKDACIMGLTTIL